MKHKPDHIPQTDWDAVDIPDMSGVPFTGIRSEGRSPTEVATVMRRGKQKKPTKERITIRFSRNVLESFRATGRGWQTRMDDAMKEWIKTHKIG